MVQLKGKITQEGTNPPVIVLSNDEIIAFADEQAEYIQEGQFKAVCNRAVLNSDVPPKWYDVSNTGDHYAISMVNQTDVIIQCFDRKGNPKNGILSGAWFEIETK